MSSERPPRLAEAGHSQSISRPWKPYFSRNLREESMKALRLVAREANSDQVVRVGPSSLNSQPPTPSQTLRPCCLSSTNSRYMSSSPGFCKLILNEVGSMDAKAKLSWVRPSSLICDGRTLSHGLVRMFHSLYTRSARDVEVESTVRKWSGKYKLTDNRQPIENWRWCHLHN